MVGGGVQAFREFGRGLAKVSLERVGVETMLCGTVDVSLYRILL